MTSAAAVALLVVLGGATALILFAMSFVFAQLIGWRALARAYAAPAAGGERFDASVLLGDQSYNGPPLAVVLDERGIALVPRPPFRAAFRPFVVPWERVASFEQRSYLFFDVVELRFGAEHPASIGFVPSKATEAIAVRLRARDVARIGEVGSADRAEAPARRFS